MTSEYPNIANNPYQDFSSTAPLCNELKSKIVLMELIISEKANELEPIFQKLDRMLVKEPSGRYLLEFDVESNEEGRPAMYKKQQVYNILYGITNRLITSKIKFFWWVAEHTNLAEKPETVKTMHKRASFIATTNDYQPLTDPTGSRRYLCCELTGIIDTDTPIPHKQMYAQAIHELEQGHPWYFSKQEEATIEEHNRTYQCQASPESVLLAYYEPAPSCKENFLRAVDIQQELRRHLRQADVPTIKALTMALKAQGFHHGAWVGQRGWYARRRSEE